MIPASCSAVACENAKRLLPVACIVSILAVGCLAPPKEHPWQACLEGGKVRDEAASWPVLPKSDYARVIDAKREHAVSLLEHASSAPVDGALASELAPELPPPPDRQVLAYLVRGVAYGEKPSYTIVRFDDATGRLLVLQATYDGEMLMPFRWVAQPNALVVRLRRPPTAVFPDAIVGGDGIFRGRDWRTLDTR